MSNPLEPKPSPGSKGPPWAKLATIALIIMSAVTAFKTLPLSSWMQSVTAWVESLGVWAPIAFVTLYICSTVCFLPAVPLTAFAGAFFGLAWGSLYVSLGSTLGAAAAFLVGRFLIRDRLEKRLADRQTFKAINHAVSDDGWKIVGLTRLSPVFPFTLLNYAYGLTRVRFSHYVLASWIGMIPGTILYVYIGSLGKAASEGRSPGEWALYAVGLIATILVTISITKKAKAALRSKIS